MGVLKRLAVFALILNVPLWWGVWGAMMGVGDYSGTAAPAMAAALLWLLSFPVLIAGYVIKEPRRSRRVCAAGLVMFAVMLGSMSYTFYFGQHGVWRPWRELGRAQVASVELSTWQNGERQYIDLTDEEAAAARELAAGLWVQNPCVYSWGELRIPEGMPEMSGEPTDTLVFRLASGERQSVYVRYPYYSCGHLAADEEACRQAEEFINNLSGKYFDSGDSR